MAEEIALVCHTLPVHPLLTHAYTQVHRLSQLHPSYYDNVRENVVFKCVRARRKCMCTIFCQFIPTLKNPINSRNQLVKIVQKYFFPS